MVDIGAVNSAIAYHRKLTFHFINLENKVRYPDIPETRPVKRMHAILGPRSIAIPSVMAYSSVTGKPFGPAIK